MARMIIGAGAGYLLGLYFVALTTSGDNGSTVFLNYAAIFKPTDSYLTANYVMLTCVAVGAVMGWAWDNIVSGDGPKDD